MKLVVQLTTEAGVVYVFRKPVSINHCVLSFGQLSRPQRYENTLGSLLTHP